MRVRYQMAGQQSYTAECDLTNKEAKKKFEALKKNALCEWAELVGEEDENYMEILKYFDHTEMARKVYKVKRELFG